MTNLVFAHTHVVELKSSFAWVWYSSADISDVKFHQDQQKRLWRCGGSKFALKHYFGYWLIHDFGSWLYQITNAHNGRHKLNFYRTWTFTFAMCCHPSVCLSSVCLSSVCNVRAPYSGGCNFQQYLYGIWYLGHPLTWKIVRRSPQGNPSVGELNTTGVAKYSDIGLIEGYISETVQDRR